MADLAHLSRRERQIMSILYARGEGTVSEVLEDLVDPPTRTSIRTTMRILEEKGHLKHEQQGKEYVYSPVKPHRQAATSALQQVLHTFFGGSLEKAVAMHLGEQRATVTSAELRRLAKVISDARRQEQKS